MYLVNQTVIAVREGGKKQSHGDVLIPSIANACNKVLKWFPPKLTRWALDLIWTTSGRFWTKSLEHPFCGKIVRFDWTLEPMRGVRCGKIWGKVRVVNDWPDQDGLNFPYVVGYWKHVFDWSLLLLVHRILQLKLTD